MANLFINSKREGYSIDQCGRTLTVAELIDILSAFDEDTLVYIRNDGGYTYGSVIEFDVEVDDE